MRTKTVFFLLTGCLLVLAAWLVHVPDPTQANEVPEKYRDTVRKGLEYLVKSQHKDGHWEGDGGKHPVAMTGHVGIALLMEGGHVQQGKYSANIRKAVDWLMARSQAGRDGLIFSEHPSETDRYMQGHGLATLFLAGACEVENDDARRAKLIDVLTRAVKYSLKAQSTQGGWYHTSKVEGHDFAAISPTVIQIQALQAALNVGISVRQEAMIDALEYLNVALGKYEEGAKAGQNRSRAAETAAALACRATSSSGETKDGWLKKWWKYCQTEIPVGSVIEFGRDDLTHYYYAQAMFLKDGKREPWHDYRTVMFDHLQSTQNKDGSWPASDGFSVGPVYATAVWCTILQLDQNCHPSTRRVAPITRRE